MRTTEEFMNATQLADQLLANLPVEAARTYRERLRAVTVRVVQIHTIEEEMRYDTAYFAVEAGRPVQVVLKNDDLMPHNLVITQPGAIQEIAEEGALLGPNPGFEGKPYVPKSDKVMHATGMVQVGQLERLTFTAPQEPGEYPYVCTFPRHWMRMYGVMVVVQDLDAWLKNPVKPKDPIGSNREFVKAWTMEDYQDDLGMNLQSRSPEIGAKLFKEATCAQCHPIKGEGGKVGPELSDVFKRWKGDRQGVLREILEPSHRIEPKYAVQMILTTDGLPLTGIVTAEDKESISLVINPEAPKPLVIPRTKIEEMVKASKSMMPKALLDRFNKEEVLEILAYLEGLSPAAK
jgi:putative heme-binding domain-containing protein